MNRRTARLRLLAVLASAMGLAAPTAWAQTAPAASAPSTAAIVEALKPTTRSLRNLIVARPDAAASAASSSAGAAPIGNVATAPGSVATPPLPPAAPSAASTSPSPATAALTAPTAPPSLSMAIQFDFDSARIRAESLGSLDNLAAALTSADLRASRFLVEGHTDGTGSASYNLRLSEQRAAEVKRYLVAHGVGAERVATVGRGSTQPADVEHPAAAENRRVRIVNVD